MFFLQLRQLVWKNFIVRKRSKFRVFTELVWPVILFGILAWVRTRGLKENKPECFQQERALPSAGILFYLQSMMCSLSNNCYSKPLAPFSLRDEIDSDMLNSLISDLEEILSTRITDEEADSGSKVFTDVFSTGLYAYTTYESGNLPKIALPLANIINQEALDDLVERKNLSSAWAPLVLDATLQLPSQDYLKSLRDDPLRIFCNATSLGHILSAANDTLDQLSEVFCSTPPEQIFNLINTTALFNETLNLVEGNTGQKLNPDNWLKMGRLLASIATDVRQMESLLEIFQRALDTPVGQLAHRLASGNITAATALAMNASSLTMVSDAFCGNNTLKINNTSLFVRPQRGEFRKKMRRKNSTAEKAKKTTNRPADVRMSTECNNLFYTLQQEPITRPFFDLFYPLVRGKLLYSPNTSLFDGVIADANRTFQDLRQVQRTAQIWIDDVSPRVRDFVNTTDLTIVLRTVRSLNLTLPILDNITSIAENRAELTERLNEILEKLDNLAELTTTYIDCYEFEKFEGYATEEQAVKRGLDLMATNDLWAIISFQHEDLAPTTTTLPQHIKYKIRMDSYKVDTTKKIRDEFRTPVPRINPRTDMKYFMSGFIYLQDLIEQAIIKNQTGRQQLPAMFMQPFPSPCYVFDTFFIAIAQLFPLFMVLSFVYTSSMTVKSVVYEKEQRLKETMRTMGLSNGVHWLAWFIDCMSTILPACIFLTLVLVYGKILEKSDPILVFCFVISFSIATVCQSFLISTFFTRANLAAACGGFIFFICFLPYNVLDMAEKSYSFATKILLSLISNVAFGIGCSYFAKLEQGHSGANWSNLNESVVAGDGFSLYWSIIMMLVDSVLYLLATWYIEAVFPGEYGVPKPFYFMFMPSYWCPNYKKRKAGVDNEPPVFSKNFEITEEIDDDMRVGVRIRNLGKTYSNGKVALRNLNLDFCEDQITAFLGHNGAGKTTTISVLTGLYTPSTGTATINGQDIHQNMDEIRKQLGLCPQFNVLFDKLTVEEHMWFYACLKSGHTLVSRKEIDMMIDDVGLSHKRKALPPQLSGGMKRKLSIGTAFIGGSKTVILDEPTAGVDPYSRRSIWDILLKYKKGRTIILTTHFMDEADLLGDRIAIIAQGQLKCCGSSLFLKRKIGSGYYLTLVKEDGGNGTEVTSLDSDASSDVPPMLKDSGSQSVEALVKRHVSNAAVVGNIGSDLVFCLPHLDNEGNHQRSKFALLFDELDTIIERLGFSSYGISDTTLEEVFLKVANDPSDEKEEEPEANGVPVSIKLQTISSKPFHGGKYLYSEVSQREEISSEQYKSDTSVKNLVKLVGFRLIFQQVVGLYLKRFHNSRRSLKGFFCEVVLPAVFITINLLTTMQFRPTQPEPPLILSPWLYGESNTAFYSINEATLPWPVAYRRQLLNDTGMGVRCLAENPLRLPCSEDVGLENPSANPDDYENIRCPCANGYPSCPANVSSAELARYASVSTDKFYDLTGKDISLWILRSDSKLRDRRYGGFEFGVNNPLSSVNFTQLARGLARLSTAARIENNFNLNTNQRILELGNQSTTRGVLDGVRVWFNNKAWATSVAYLNAINNVVLRSSLPPSADASRYGITAINHPMNYTGEQQQDMITAQIGLSVLNAVGVIFSMSFVPASFVIFLVEERSSKAKHLQFVSGVKPVTFWVASYTWDMLNYIMPTLLMVIIFVAFNCEPYISERNFPGLISLLIFYGLSSIPLMYPVSMLFDVPSSAFVSLSCINLFLGIITTISTFVLQLFDDEELKFIASVISQVFLIFPHYCLGRGLIDMAQTHYFTKSLQAIGLDNNKNLADWDYLGRNITCMFLQSIIFFSFNLMLHYQILPDFIQRRFQSTSKWSSEPDDEDVARERHRIEQNMETGDSLRLLQLTKVYQRNKRPAVNQISFGVRKGECFGLLGVNGAGKSTTFKMLTGDESVTKGDAFVGGHSILTDLERARQNLGYCPQEDALLPLLTGVEHLQLFARLRGIPPSEMNQVVNDSLEKLSLIPYKDRCAGTYSGGNKRKLSTAVSLIGSPPVVFLDEPSSGMDPRARRTLWNAVLNAVKESRSVLLTSHSMEECQVLCNRLAIMVNGTLKCLGSPQHLKNRFGNGYMINVRCHSNSEERVLLEIEGAIPEARLREKRNGQMVWHVEPDVLSVAAMFLRMEEARNSSSHLEDYSISQTTLDDVFIRFATHQKEDTDDLIAEVAV